MNLFTLFMTALLTENIVLTKFLGLCPVLGTSNKEKNAFFMGLSVTFVIVMSSLLTYMIYHMILVPTDTVYLKTLVFILLIAALVQLVEIILKRFFKSLHDTLGIYLPLITTNCAVLGVVLLNIASGYSLVETLVFAFGSSLGFMAVIYVFASMREKLENAPIPKAIKGYPIAFLIASIMAIIFSRFTVL